MVKIPAYRDKNTGTWYIKFRYTDWQGKSKQTTKRGFKTKKDALNYEHEFKASSNERVDITLGSLAEKYLEDRKLHVKASRYTALENTIRKQILPYIGNLKLTELTPTVMRQWQNELMKQGLSASTLLEYNRRCSTLLNFGVKYYGMSANPLRTVGSIGHSENRVDFWELNEFERFIEVVDNEKYKICFLLLFYSGMRVGELLALDLRDFDFLKNKISVTKNLMKVNGAISTPKTKYSVRVIDMPPLIMQMVKEYSSKLDEVTSPLFSVKQQTLLNALKRYAKKADLKEICIQNSLMSRFKLLKHIFAENISLNNVIDGKIFQIPNFDFRCFCVENVAYGNFSGNTLSDSTYAIHRRVHTVKDSIATLGIKSYMGGLIEGRGLIQIDNYSCMASTVVFEMRLNHDHNQSNVSIYGLSHLDWGVGLEFFPETYPAGTRRFSYPTLKIGSDVWIGLSTRFKVSHLDKPLIIGNGAIIAADSVVVKDVLPFAIVGGNPAKFIKWRFNQKVIEGLQRIAWWNWDLEKIYDNFELFRNPEEFVNKFDV